MGRFPLPRFQGRRRGRLRSKAGQPFDRYFPEVVAGARKRCRHARSCSTARSSFPTAARCRSTSCCMRIHPAAKPRARSWRGSIRRCYVVFDLLVDDARRGARRGRPLAERRARAGALSPRRSFAVRRPLSAARRRPASARDADAWLASLRRRTRRRRSRSGVDLAYRSGERTGMQKFKRHAHGGLRRRRLPLRREGDGSSGRCCSACTTTTACCTTSASRSNIQRQRETALTQKLEQLIEPPGFTGRAPGGPSRWSTERAASGNRSRRSSWSEVRYDHFSGGRFRHGTRFLRWRPDKAPRSARSSKCLRNPALSSGYSTRREALDDHRATLRCRRFRGLPNRATANRASYASACGPPLSWRSSPHRLRVGEYSRAGT